MVRKVNEALFLIDGHALCYKSFYAIQALTNSRGQPTNAVLGFVNILKKILREYEPQYMAICFDSIISKGDLRQMPLIPKVELCPFRRRSREDLFCSSHKSGELGSIYISLD